MKNYIQIGTDLLKLFLGDNELEYLEMIGEDNNPYRIALELDTSVDYN